MMRAVQVLLKSLARFSPFENSVWDIYRPITEKGVELAVEREQLLARSTTPSIALTRTQHIRRVAWLVVHGWTDPIELDVGCLDYHNDWFVCDGNHRHAAAIFWGDKVIGATVAGDLDYAEEQLGITVL